jgi:chromosome segregation ATPase
MTKEKTIHELMKEHPDKSYREMEKYREADRAQEAGQCIMGEMRKDREDLSWKEKYNKERKLRQEAEGELTIVKGISVHMSPEMRDAQKKIKELQDSLDRFKKENNECYSRIAEALEVNESHQKLNGKLQERLTELEEENKKMHNHLAQQVESARKAGM